MKKLVVTLIAILCLVLSSCASNSENIRLATGGNTGTYYAYGTALAKVLAEKSDVKFTVESTGASKANIQLIAGGEVQMAIVQNDVMAYAYDGTDLFAGESARGFMSMAGLYTEVCQIIANPSSGITSIEDLKGKRVSVGDAGSGVEFNAAQILSAYGISFDNIQKQNLSFAASADAIKNNQIDAFFCTAGAPTTAITELATTNAITVLEVDEAHATQLQSMYPFYVRYPIPANTYGGVAEEKWTVAVKATLIVSEKLSEDTVYKLTKALFENQPELLTAHAKAAELLAEEAVKSITVPFHPGAEKYYNEIGVL